jgi:rubrerythrin
MKPQTADLGRNLTGVDVHRERSDSMEKGMEEFPPSSTGTTEGAGMVRVVYSKQGDKVGSIPPPSGLVDKAKTAMEAVAGQEPTLFMDKLGERLAFERAGTRLYEAVVSKHEAFGGFEGGPSREDLEEILNEELEHFTLLERVMRQQGGDPTAITPSADLATNAGAGLQDVILDPRTTLLQSLEALLVAELTDNEGWDTLIELAHMANEDDLVSSFENARRVEEEHLAKVRRWLRAGQGRADGQRASG